MYCDPRPPPDPLLAHLIPTQPANLMEVDRVVGTAGRRDTGQSVVLVGGDL